MFIHLSVFSHCSGEQRQQLSGKTKGKKPLPRESHLPLLAAEDKLWLPIPGNVYTAVCPCFPSPHPALPVLWI